ncbi:MAG: DNA-binding domain-containing protein, partial [Gammaproteobacteria bacterium]
SYRGAGAGALRGDPMIGLQELQAWFRRSLQAGDDAVLSHLAGSEKRAVSERLGIYQHAYRSRLVEALGKDYPVVQMLLGEEADPRNPVTLRFAPSSVSNASQRSRRSSGLASF